MEECSLSLYTKLKMNLYKEITISYYSNIKDFKTENFTLIDVYDFSYILISNKKVLTDMYFFSTTSLIESITIVGEDNPIYFNPYIKEYINQASDTNEIVEKVKTAFFSNISINQMITERELFLIKYNERGIGSLKDLFFSNEQRNDFNVLFKQLVKKLSEYAKSKGLDSKIKPIRKGSTSLVYGIGNKIIKIGKPRKNSIVPYCEYLLQPIINRDFLFDGIPIHIEVTEKVLTYEDLDYNEQQKLKFEILKLRIKLFSIGLKCSDLHTGNIGILTHDNVINYDSIPFQTGNETATSIQYNNNLKVRKKGEVVIIDLDYLKIVNIHKYCNYLARIGYDQEKIADIKKTYKKSKIR